MKFHNKSNKHYLLRCGTETMLLRAGNTDEIPEHFHQDPAFRVAVCCGDIVPEEVKIEPAPAETPAEPVEAAETAEEEPAQEEAEPKKPATKRTKK